MKKHYKKNTQVTEKESIRLNKFIAMSGIASRRRADEFIWSGCVRINGKTITELGTMVHPANDTVVVNGKPIKIMNEKVYAIFNKPTQVVTTMNEPEGRPSIRDYFTQLKIRLFPVGKLDWDAEGLVLLTNDGEFAQKVNHPQKNDEVANTYLLKLSGQPSDEHLQKLTRGISIIGGKTHALAVKRMPARGSEKYDWVKLIICESSNKQIHAMFAKLGFDVKKIQRIAIGSLKMANLERGKFKILTADDVKKVFVQPKEIRKDEDEKATHGSADKSATDENFKFKPRDDERPKRRPSHLQRRRPPKSKYKRQIR